MHKGNVAALVAFRRQIKENPEAKKQFGLAISNGLRRRFHTGTSTRSSHPYAGTTETSNHVITLSVSLRTRPNAQARLHHEKGTNRTLNLLNRGLTTDEAYEIAREAFAQVQQRGTQPQSGKHHVGTLVFT